MSNRSEVIKLGIAIIVLALIIIAGVKAVSNRVDQAEYSCQVRYVAESEIMELEKTRVQMGGSSNEEQNLFFGDIDKAVKLTMEIASRKNKEKTKVIFSLLPVYAEGVESISKEVHEEVIRQMHDRNVDSDQG